MDIRSVSNSLDPASEAIQRVQREVLLRLGTELLASQRAALATVQAELDATTHELSVRIASWRRRTIGIISLSTGMLVPWLVLLALLGIGTLVLGARTRDAWSDYREAAGAHAHLRAQGTMTFLKDGQLYVRVDPASLARGQHGNWYARAVKVELREERESAGP